jgi:hypothetical protein
MFRLANEITRQKERGDALFRVASSGRDSLPKSARKNPGKARKNKAKRSSFPVEKISISSTYPVVWPPSCHRRFS